MKDPRLVRLDATRLRVLNEFGVDITLFADEEVLVESAAVDELVQMVALRSTVERLAENDSSFFDVTPEVSRVAVTPDFHKGVGIPIGTVMATRGFLVPQAIGNDINCGMRLHLTSLKADQVIGKLDDLEARCRHTYFEGGRSIPMTRHQREGLFRGGLAGLVDAVPRSQTEGLWSMFHETAVEQDLARTHSAGSMETGRIFGEHDFLDTFLGPREGFSRDGQIGSIGGGNHFVELQRVARILDGPTAHEWGLKEGMVTIMVHSGSLSIGHHCGSHFRDVLRNVYPTSLRAPANGIFLLPEGERHREVTRLFWDAMSNAANFAFVNRLFLALMAIKALKDTCGAFDVSMLYDAPHNLVWREQLDGKDVFLHRKGACPARGFEAMEDTPFAYYGEPVLVPGSMGASSFVLAGRGNPEALWSASHGAGRAMSRGDALRGNDDAFRKFMRDFRVVTPVDLRRPDIQMRRDIVDKKLEDIKKEAPFAYKGIGAVIRTITAAGMAQPVAELTPLMTVKG
jgi:tRNA-splicing ligase RtcB